MRPKQDCSPKPCSRAATSLGAHGEKGLGLFHVPLIVLQGAPLFPRTFSRGYVAKGKTDAAACQPTPDVQKQCAAVRRRCSLLMGQKNRTFRETGRKGGFEERGRILPDYVPKNEVYDSVTDQSYEGRGRRGGYSKSGIAVVV